MTKELLKVAVLIGLCLALVSLPYPHLARSQVGEGDAGGGGGGKPKFSKTGMVLFGGKIEQVVVCTCGIFAYLYIKVGKPVPAELILTSASLQYLWYSYVNNSWALGDALPVKISCMVLVGEDCVQEQQGYMIFHIGTSLPAKSSGGGGGGIEAP